MNKQKIYFVSGVCGVGKSSIMPYLKSILPQGKYIVRDFDERGVPDGADHSWRVAEIENWMSEGVKSAENAVELIVCGFVKPEDFKDSNDLEVVIIVLDAEPETIRKRLVGRYTKNGVFDETQKVIGKPVNEFIESNIYYCQIMKKECEQAGCSIINTTNLSPEEVANEVSKII